MGEMKLPFEGIRVLDLTTSHAGPCCTMFLADMGADVVKVEQPEGGDDSRYWGPPFLKGISPWFLSVNRNKRGISLNLGKPQGLEILQKLLRKADVFVVSLSIGALERLNLQYNKLKELNPRLIYCSITGFGHTGPYRNRLCYDLISEGIGGVMSVTGDNDHPEKVGTAAGDILAAHHASFAIACCLYRRESTGLGDFVDICLVDSVVSFVNPRIVSYLSTGELPRPDANRTTPIAVYQPIRTRDGYLNVAIGNDRIWERICNLLGLKELLQVDSYKTNEGRKIHRMEIVAQIEKSLTTNETQYWFNYLSENGVPCGPIYYLNQVVEDPQIQSREMVFRVEDSELGTIPQVNHPWKLAQTQEKRHKPPPRVGEHNEEVFEEWLGWEPRALADLRKLKIIG